jgi:Domain of unknown function (DUF5666)
VNLPAPLTIHGSAMAVSLDLQALPSATFTSQGTGQPDTYTITPTFTLSAAALLGQPQVQLMGVDGLVSSINSGSNSLSLMIAYGFNNPSYPDGATFTVATNASTVYQGIGNFSRLAAGMIANLDLTLQSDGSLLATRVEVDDPSATNVLTGPLGTVFDAQSLIAELGRTNEEFNQCAVPGGIIANYSFDGSTAFKFSGEIAVPSNLPFSATQMLNSNAIALGNVLRFNGLIFNDSGTARMVCRQVNDGAAE